MPKIKYLRKLKHSLLILWGFADHLREYARFVWDGFICSSVVTILKEFNDTTSLDTEVSNTLYYCFLLT